MRALFENESEIEILLVEKLIEQLGLGTNIEIQRLEGEVTQRKIEADQKRDGYRPRVTDSLTLVITVQFRHRW